LSFETKGEWHPRRISFGAAGPPSLKYSNPSWLEQLRVFHKLEIRYRLGFVEAGPPSLKLWHGRLYLAN
jgi:hypothetical protein